MLFPKQVLPFLEHEDERVREHAARYLGEAHDPSPATADDVWRAVDKVGLERSDTLVLALRNLPHSDAAFARALRVIQQKADADVARELVHVLEAIDFDVLARHRDEILGCEQIPPDSRDHLRERLELVDQPPEALWDRLMQFAATHEQSDAGTFDSRIVQRLVEGVARAPSFAVERAMAVLSDSSIEDWREIFAVQVIGAVRYRPALDLLLRRLLLDTDVLREEVDEALVRIGDEAVARKVGEFYPGKEDHVRIYARAPLAQIKLPASEQTLLRLLEIEQERDLRTLIAADLCDLCSERGFAEVRRMVISGEHDPMMVDLRELLLVLSIMTGTDLPEAGRWRAELAERDRQTALRMQQIESFASAKPRPKHMPKGVEPDSLPEGFDPIAPPVTLRRDELKIGRNDPCPCGSGKKYKKCCLGKA